jgi:L-asparagine permease
VVLVINLLSARAFGEFEFWAAIAKVGAIVIFLVVGLVVVVGGFSIGGHEAGFHNLWSNPGGFWPSSGDFNWYGPLLAMSGVVFAYAAIEMVGVAAGEMQDSRTEVPKAVNAVIFRIAVFYCGSILLLVSMLPTSEYKSGTSPFVTVFERLGLTWMTTAIQIVLIIAAMSSLNAGLYSTGRVLRSLGMSKQAPQFTLKMSAQGVPWAGILMTSVVFVFGSLLNFLAPDAFEIALEAAAIGVLFTWSTIFLCQLKLRRLSDRGVIPPSPFQMPGHPWTSYIGLVFLVLVLVGMAISGWQASPYLSHKVTFLVVVFGVPIISLLLALGWRLVKPAVIANTGDRLKAVWSDDGPTYGPGVSPEDLDVAEHDPATAGRNLLDLNDDGSFVGDEDGKESR